MKKNYTFLMALALFFSLNVFSQTSQWDFNDSTSGWSAVNFTSIATATPGDTFATVTMSDDPNTAVGYTNNNSKVFSTTADMDTSAGGYIAITLQNNTENTRIQVALKSVFINFNDLLQASESSSFETYYLYVGGNAQWTGIVNDVQFRFKEVATTGPTSLAGTVLIDKIEIVASVPTIERTDYTFDSTTDAEGFIGQNDVVLSQPIAGEINLLIPTAQLFPKFTQNNTYHVDAGTYKYAKVTLVNQTVKDKLTFVFPSEAGNKFEPSVMTANSTAEQTIYFDLSAQTNWTGLQSAWFLQINEESGTSSNTVAETLIIKQIEFTTTNTNPSLGVNDVDYKDDTSISLFPNPVKDVFKVSAPSTIKKMEVYNVLGQQQNIQSKNVNSVDVSTLSKGVYFIKIYQDNDTVSTKRFIKE
jgi:hypothetical protein